MLNNPCAPDYRQVLETCQKIFQLTENENEVLEYLSEVASSDYECPDKCDQWAVEFYNENEKEISKG